jgi:hypothetical protein
MHGYGEYAAWQSDETRLRSRYGLRLGSYLRRRESFFFSAETVAASIL